MLDEAWERINGEHETPSSVITTIHKIFVRLIYLSWRNRMKIDWTFISLEVKYPTLYFSALSRRGELCSRYRNITIIEIKFSMKMMKKYHSIATGSDCLEYLIVVLLQLWLCVFAHNLIFMQASPNGNINWILSGSYLLINIT